MSETEKPDIVERVRSAVERLAYAVKMSLIEWNTHSNNLLEAAAEIERLRALPSRSDVLEEAARVADAVINPQAFTREQRKASDAAEHIAAAIRALKKDTDNG